MKILEIAGQLSSFHCRFMRVTDEGSLPEIAQYCSEYLQYNVFSAPKGSFFLLYKLLKISLFIGPKRPCDKSSNCHINWLARAVRSILVTKFRADVLVPLSHSAAHILSKII